MDLLNVVSALAEKYAFPYLCQGILIIIIDLYNKMKSYRPNVYFAYII